MENLLFIGLADVEIKIDFSIILRGHQNVSRLWKSEQQSLSPHSMGKYATKINVFQGLIWHFHLLFIYLILGQAQWSKIGVSTAGRLIETLQVQELDGDKQGLNILVNDLSSNGLVFILGNVWSICSINKPQRSVLL